MADHALLLQALRNFATAMGRSYDINEMSIRLSERVTEALGVEGAGVSVADQDGRLKFVTATSEKILGIEQVQEEFQQGPCVIAFKTQKPVALDSIENAAEWSAYKDAARRLGLKAVVGFPLGYENTRLGALNIYAAEERQWSDDDMDVLGVFADMATAYLVRDTELAESRDPRYTTPECSRQSRDHRAGQGRSRQRVCNQRRQGVRSNPTLSPDKQRQALRGLRCCRRNGVQTCCRHDAQ